MAAKVLRRSSLSAPIRGIGRISLPLLVGLVTLFIYAPILILMIFSFNDAGNLAWWDGFSLKWYQQLLAGESLWSALQVSLIVTSTSVLISTVLGTITAYALYRWKFWGKRLFENVLYLPLYVPEVVLGISLMMLFILLKIPRGITTMILAHVAFTIPVVVLVVLARMQRVDWSLEEAAMDLGADELMTLRKVTVPLLMPGILAAALLAFPWSFNDFVITYFVTGPGQTPLSVLTYDLVLGARRTGAMGQVNALGTLMTLTTLLLPLLGFLLLRLRRFSPAQFFKKRGSLS
ncbi:ABC transporter permease [Candidatus Acetothermia bacterium]|nr:ABC transporter permease [Candidatus Acetothermia bacterium]MBI3643201.1 ABC transporter permease [Candidatus Acetothermia bacterium]